jgi:hypothetical protein
MRAVIIGTDFIKDIDGSFKALETNTNIGMDVDIVTHMDSQALTNLILDNSINEVHLIHSSANLQIFENLEIPHDARNFGIFLSESICLPNNIEYIPHRVDINSVTIPHIEDGDNKLIIRVCYDTTALMDDVYARDNWEFLKIMHENDANSIPKCYINDLDLGIDNIGEDLRDNGNHPNYCIKKRITPADNKVYPKLYKIDTIEQLENLKSNLEVDEYIQEYIYNTEELIENKTFHYRSVDLVYGQLDSLNLYVYNKTNMTPIVDSCDFDDSGVVQVWDRPRYVSKVLNSTGEISVRLDADATTKIVMVDNGIITADNLNLNNEVKSVHFSDITSLTTDINWSGSYNNLSQNYNITSSKVIEKDTFNYYGPIVNIELDNGSMFSDVPHGRIFNVVSIPNEDTIETIVKMINYEDLSIGDSILVLNNETNIIETKTIANIEYYFEELQAYRINVEESDLFLSMEETENQSVYAILTHNYDYDCMNFSTGYGGQYVFCCKCNDNDCWYHADADVCCRYGGPYGTSFTAWQNSYYGYSSCCSAYNTGVYCNGSKPSDMRLKKNIIYSHTLPRGLKIYTFEFNDDFVSGQKEKNNEDYSGKWQGVLAQDLINTNYEDCLNLRDDAFFEVNYNKLNLELTKIN